ncbi:probable transcription repressor OFP9 [Andrographis paniculata]|uniref:probable transcription repressor OFP9 n=1 Tax=Andrographis paniculata TaxID=175694 RepID=UPI0021E82FD7|nr:probable transcription repressor OFP9 [Andrographis paniculata]
MQKSKAVSKKQRKAPQSKGCNRGLCCTCRLSVSSSEEAESSLNSSSSSSERYPSISSIAHAMVQERLDQMIRERQEARHEERVRRRGARSRRVEETKFVVMVAMEKSTYDAREDFRESMMQMIVANRIYEVRDLRRLLNYYVTMNGEEFLGIILEAFYDVCTDLFLHCKRY